MIEDENEKIPICSSCLEILTTNINFASHGYLYHKNCFTELNFESPISRQDFSFCLPVNNVVNVNV